MEKYELNGNIIMTTKERYENSFKRLGYKPYKEEKAIERETEIKPSKKIKKSLKDD